MRRSLIFGVVMVASLLVLVVASPAAAADSPLGTWVKKGEEGKITLSIEEWSPGKAKLTWRLTHSKIVLTLVSVLDGSDAPLLMDGKPTGETMSIKLIDKRHASATVKMKGKTSGTSKSTFSEDFKTMTVENDFSEPVGGNAAGKSTEIWTRK